jgi:hypothetical protein
MKLYTPLLITFFLTGVLVHAQQYDAQWVIGPNTSVIDFRQADTVLLRTQPKDIPTSFTNASICDETGNLLYYTNGIYIADRNGDTVMNGSGLSPCAYSDDSYEYGLSIIQSTLFLPKPGNNRLYFLIHYSYDILNDTRPGTLYYSIIDKQGNFGLGEAVQKNKIFTNGAFRGGGITACRHANGRDWWIVMGESNNNTFDKFLLTPDSLLGPFKQAIGPVFSLPFDNATAKFSPDGSKYVTGAFVGNVLVMDFDRCTGEFSNPISIFNNSSTDPVNHPLSGSASVEFSPNGRFVYVTNSNNLTQYDLLEGNIQDSVELYSESISVPIGLDFLQLAPNGKIYASTWSGGSYFIHVIKHPDEKGDSCQFIYAGQPTLSLNSVNLPNIVNYRLGALAGSACDTITTGIRNENHEIMEQPSISPNPADKYMYIEMPQQGNYTFELLNANGQLIVSRETKQVDIINTESLESGVYFLRITDPHTNHELSTVKLAVKH